VAVLGRMRTPDGHWVVEVFTVRREQWYRILYLGGVYRERTTLGEVLRVLREDAEVDPGDLIED